MKIAKIILLFLALLLTNCSGELEQEYGLMPPAPGQVTFLLGLQEDDTSAIQTRNGEPEQIARMWYCLLYTSPSPRDSTSSRMPSSA